MSPRLCGPPTGLTNPSIWLEHGSEARIEDRKKHEFQYCNKNIFVRKFHLIVPRIEQMGGMPTNFYDFDRCESRCTCAFKTLRLICCDMFDFEVSWIQLRTCNLPRVLGDLELYLERTSFGRRGERCHKQVTRGKDTRTVTTQGLKGEKRTVYWPCITVLKHQV